MFNMYLEDSSEANCELGLQLICVVFKMNGEKICN